MTSAFISWFEKHGEVFVEESIKCCDRSDIFSVLSVGSGEGDVDLAIVQNLIPHLRARHMRLKYVALEPNPIHRQCFLARLQELSLDESIEICVLEDRFAAADSAGDRQRYHLILLVHVLYYFRDPYLAIQHALARLEPQGKAIVAHQEETGIPQIQRQHMMSLKGDREELLTAEIVKNLLVEKGHDFSYQSVDASLDITEGLAGSEAGIKIMSFCMECDLRHLEDSKLDRLTRSFRALANFKENGRAFIEEPIGVFILPSLPSLFAENRPSSRILADRDPTQDYWQLAKNFDWSGLLSQETDSESIRVLDVACGTGRWLQALQHYVKLKNEPARIIYDLLDPNQDAIVRAIQNLKPPFQFGQQYATNVQEAKLDRNAYDLLWSMHGFYNIPREDLAYILEKCTNSLKATGVGAIALATRKSFYVDFYDRYLDAFYEGRGSRFTSSEDVVAALSKCHIKHSVNKILYEEPIHIADLAALEHYIKTESTVNSFNKGIKTEQLSVAEDISFKELMVCPPIRKYLESLIRDSFYYFPQEIWLIEFYR